MKYLKRFQAGKPLISQLTASRLNQILEALEERTPLPGKGTRLNATSRGFSYSSKPTASQTGGPLPWRLSAGADNAIKVYPGAVTLAGESIMPTIDGIAMDNDPQPELQANGSTRVWLRVVTAWNMGTAEYTVGGPSNQAEYNIVSSINEIVSVTIVASFAEPGDSTYCIPPSNQSIQYFQIGTRNGTGQFFQTAYGPGYGQATFTGQVDYVTGATIPEFAYIALSGTAYEP